MSKKLIELHKEWVQKGRISDGGLCVAVPKEYEDDLEMFSPTVYEQVGHSEDGYWLAWWGRHKTETNSYRIYNPFRQTIVLLICAMNNEL